MPWSVESKYFFSINTSQKLPKKTLKIVNPLMSSHVTCLTMKVADWVLSHKIQLQAMILTTLKYQNGAQKALKKVLRYH